MEDLDDLFTDQLNDQLNDHLDGGLGIVPVLPALPGLAERVDELRLNGCSQKIAWSRMGAIAYITSDGLDVRICSLHFRVQEGAWGMSQYTDPMLTEQLQKAFRGRELVHVSFNPFGTELLIISSCGKIAVCATVIAINRLLLPKPLNDEAEDNSNTVVGLVWLNYKRPFSIGNLAMKKDNDWLYAIFQQEAKGPHHPEGKSAFVIVTRGGTVKLCYMGRHDYLHVKHELDGVSTSTDLLTHAALCQDKDDSLLLVVANTAKQLRLYSMKIDWQSNKTTEQQPAAQPIISIQHVAMVDYCAPSMESIGSQSSIFMIAPVPEPELSHLELIPRKPETRPGRKTLPIALAIFSHVPNVLAGEIRESSYSILTRWELVEEKPNLDPTFTQLVTKNAPGTELKDEQFLKKVEDVRIERVVLHVHHVSTGHILSIAYGDGSVEFRDRDFALLPMNDKRDIATSLSQLGFSFTDQEPCLHVAISPSACAKVSFGKVHELQVSSLQIPIELVDANETLEKIAAAWTLQNTVAETSLSMGNSTNDDLIMILYHFLLQLPKDQRRQVEQQCLRDSYKALQAVAVLVDAVIDKIIRFPPLVRCLSLQAALGYHGEKRGRSLGSKVASILMNMRFIAVSFGFALMVKPNPNVPGGAELDINRPETLQYITGLVLWTMTLADYLTDQLFELNRILNVPDSFDVDLLREQATKSPAIALILLSMSRSLLHYNFSGLRRLAPLTGSPIARAPSPLAPYYANLASTFRSCIAAPPDVDGILTEADRLLKEAYAPLSEIEKQQLELRILVDGEVPDIVVPALRQILSGVVESTRRKLGDREAELAFKDFNILGIDDDGKARRWRRQTMFDGVRKVDLGKKKIRARTCVRCGTMMEDMLPGRGMKAYWMYNLIRCCICGGHWITDKPWWIKSTSQSALESNSSVNPA